MFRLTDITKQNTDEAGNNESRGGDDTFASEQKIR